VIAAPLRPCIRSPPTRSLAREFRSSFREREKIMRKKLTLGGVVVLLLAVASVTVASASSSPRSSAARDDDDAEVIRLRGVTVDEAFLDLGAQGDSLGDQFVFNADLYRDDERVGIAGAHCTLVRLEAAVSVSFQCLATAELPRGQITTQGLLTFSEETEGEPEVFAITGGTGRYRTAHGEVIVREVSETEDHLTFRIIR
jgi:hypothetical protein